MTINYPVITDAGARGDPVCESSVVKALTGAGRATSPGRSIKRTLQFRYATHSIRIGGICGCRVRANWTKAESAMKPSLCAVAGATGIRAAAWGERTGRVKWGPSAVGGPDPQFGGIMHKPPGDRQRRRCGRSKRRADRTIQPVGEPRATGRAGEVRRARCRLVARPATEPTLRTEITPVTAYKRAGDGARRWPWHEARLKPCWGKPAARNFRGDGGNEVHGLVAICHETRKGGYDGSH